MLKLYCLWFGNIHTVILPSCVPLGEGGGRVKREAVGGREERREKGGRKGKWERGHPTFCNGVTLQQMTA